MTEIIGSQLVATVLIGIVFFLIKRGFQRKQRRRSLSRRLRELTRA